MLQNIKLKASSSSYSQFLRSKQHSIHCLSSPDVSVDIEFFKRSISLHYQHAYANKKWQSWFYRSLFFSFGCLFLGLAVLIFFKTTNFACGLYFTNCALAKNCLNFSCLLLAGGAFIFGYKIHPEKDAIQYLVGKVEKELSYPAKHLQIEFHAIFANLSHPNRSKWPIN